MSKNHPSKTFVKESMQFEGANGAVFNDAAYIRSAGKVITDALQQQCDVLQLPNGDVVVTEVRTLIYQYHWDAAKNRMIRTQLDAKPQLASDDETLVEDFVEVEESALEDA